MTTDTGNLTEPPSVNDEIAAMRRLVNALEPLEAATRRRVLTWLVDRYQHDTAPEEPG